MTEQADEMIDAIVIGFDDEERVLAQPTAQFSVDDLSSLINHVVEYEDFKGIVWKGKVLDVVENVLVIEFERSAISQGGPSGLGQGSLVRIRL